MEARASARVSCDRVVYSLVNRVRGARYPDKGTAGKGDVSLGFRLDSQKTDGDGSAK